MTLALIHGRLVLVWALMLWVLTPVSAHGTPTVSLAHPLKYTRCIQGYERFLPAHYHFCMAIKDAGLDDYVSARRDLDEAAQWGSKQAEYMLGVMYRDGIHEPVDRAKALGWLSLAAERRQTSYEMVYQALRISATPAEVSAAQRFVARLGPRYTDVIAAARAEARYHQGMLWLRGQGRRDHVCLSGMITPRGATGSPDAAAIASRCPTPYQMNRDVDTLAQAVFDGWDAHVIVQPLQQVPLLVPDKAGD